MLASTGVGVSLLQRCEIDESKKQSQNVTIKESRTQGGKYKALRKEGIQEEAQRV